MTTRSIKGKTALITGGVKNLGALISQDFAQHGVKALALHYHSAESKTAAEALAETLEQKGVKIFTFQGDLSRPETMRQMFRQAEAALGSIDIAVNTVGRVLKKPIMEISEAEYDVMSAVNAKSAFFFLQEAGKHLRDNGAIISVVTSLLGAYTPFYAAYAGLKAPVEHFTRAASKEFGGRGISVNAIGPGPMDTPFFYAQETAETVAYLSKAAALSPSTKSGLTEPQDIVPWIRLLAGEGWWLSGQTILVNGGFTAK